MRTTGRIMSVWCRSCLNTNVHILDSRDEEHSGRGFAKERILVIYIKILRLKVCQLSPIPHCWWNILCERWDPFLLSYWVDCLNDLFPQFVALKSLCLIQPFIISLLFSIYHGRLWFTVSSIIKRGRKTYTYIILLQVSTMLNLKAM